MKRLTLQKMCPEVFVLDEDEIKILKHLAINGPLNLNQLSKHTSKYALGLDRWAVKKRLEGTRRFMGLIPNDYVIEEQTEKHRYNKPEKRYWLTVKGIIAITGIVPLSKNILFQHYTKSIAYAVDNDQVEKFAKQAIEEFMKLLIAWHYLQGIELTKQKSSNFYYIEFLEHIRRVNGIDITITDKVVEKEFIQIVRNCISYYTVVDLLTGHGLDVWSHTLSIVDWKETKEVTNQKNYHWYAKIWEWSLNLGNPTDHRIWKLGKLRNITNIRTSVEIDEVYSDDIKDKVESILQDIQYKDGWKSTI